MDHVCHIIKHFVCHSGIYTYPEGISHNAVRILKTTDDPVALSCSTHLIEAGMFGQIAGEEHTRLYTVLFQKRHEPVSSVRFLTGNEEAEPARIRMFTRNRQDQLILSGATAPEDEPNGEENLP